MANRKHTPITKHVWKPYHVLNKSVMLHGPTGTGKSKCTMFMCTLIKDAIDTVVTFCPSNDLNHDWDDVVPDIFIQKRLTTAALDAVMTTQEKKKEAIDIAEKNGDRYWRQLEGSDRIDKRYAAKIREIEANAEKNKQLMTGDDHAQVAYDKEMALYERNKQSRALIAKNEEALFKKYGARFGDKKDSTSINLTLFSLYYRLNVNMLLIIDDATDQFADVDPSVWKKLITKSRHYRITILLTTHSLNDIKVPVLRTNPFWHVFTTYGGASYFLNNTTTGVKGLLTPSSTDLENAFHLPDEQKQTQMKQVGISRDLGKIVTYTFDVIKPPRMGSKTMWKASKALESKKESRPVSLKGRMF